MSPTSPGQPGRTPRQVVETARNEDLTDVDGVPQRLTLQPAATAQEIAELERDLGRKVPAEVRDLLSFTTGFEYGPVGTVDFLGRDMSVETFFRSVPILADGYGNFWVIDVEPESGRWGAVMYWCHDPAVVVVQAATLADFLQQVVDLGRREHRDALADVREEQVLRIAAQNPYLLSAEQARLSNDPVVATFAAGMDDSWYVADLRNAEIGSGLSWGGSYSELTRNDDKLLFGVKRTSFLRRLFGRS